MGITVITRNSQDYYPAAFGWNEEGEERRPRLTVMSRDDVVLASYPPGEWSAVSRGKMPTPNGAAHMTVQREQVWPEPLDTVSLRRQMIERHEAQMRLLDAIDDGTRGAKA